MNPRNRKERMEELEFFIGTWRVEVTHPHLQPNPIVGETKFEWLDEMYIIQRTHIDKAEFPSSMIIYDWDAASGNYMQHYFDSRGVTRLYQMSFEDGVWRLWRDAADFSSLDFLQRFIGKSDESGSVIESVWEQSEDGVDWKHDFKLLFKRSERTL